MSGKFQFFLSFAGKETTRQVVSLINIGLRFDRSLKLNGP